MLVRSPRAAALTYIRAFITVNGDSPSLLQIADAIGTTKSHVVSLLDRMERERVIRRLPAAGPRRKRRIVITENQANAIATLRALGWTVNDATHVVDPPVQIMNYSAS